MVVVDVEVEKKKVAIEIFGELCTLPVQAAIPMPSARSALTSMCANSIYKF